MKNEIGTFVYRTERVSRLAGMQLLQLKKRLLKKIIVAAITMTVLVSGITTVVVLRAETNSVSADTLTNVSAETGSEPELEMIQTANLDTIGDVRQDYSQTDGTDTNRSKEAASHKEIPFYAQIEDDDELMLLGIDDGTDPEYIPADIGAQNEEAGMSADLTAEEKSQDISDVIIPEREFSSRIEEVEDKIDDATAPEDVPYKLTFCYNPNMILDLDEENLTALERIVEAEAPDQDIYGRMLVANVVINRVHEGFADTVKGVIFQKLGGSTQFAPVSDGNYYRVTVTEKTKEAVQRVLSGEDYSEGATYFFQRSTTSAKKAAWFDNELKYLFKYGCHEFYREKK